MKPLARRTATVVCILMASAPVVYLALAIRAFKENPQVVKPCYKGLVDCLDTPAGPPLELLMRANGVTVEYLHCARYEGDNADTRGTSNRRVDAEGNCAGAPFIRVTNSDKASKFARGRLDSLHETD